MGDELNARFARSAGRVPIWVVRRTPLTAAMVGAVTATAVWSGALGQGTSHDIVERWGFDLENLARGRILTLVTMHLLVFGRSHYAYIIVMLVCVLGPVEAVAGTRAAAEIFWVSAIAGVLLSSLLVGLPGHVLGWRPNPNLVREADVGGSIGGFGAVGGLTVFAGPWLGRWVWLLRGATVAYLAVALWTFRGIADVEHIAGFAIGTTLAVRLGSQRKPRDARAIHG